MVNGCGKSKSVGLDPQYFMGVENKSPQNTREKISVFTCLKLGLAVALVAGGLMLPCLPGGMIILIGGYVGGREFLPAGLRRV